MLITKRYDKIMKYWETVKNIYASFSFQGNQRPHQRSVNKRFSVKPTCFKYDLCKPIENFPWDFTAAICSFSR